MTAGVTAGSALWLILSLAGPIAAQTPDDRIKALIEAAQQAERKEDLDAAAAAYRKILELRPNWASAEFNLALVYHSQRRYREAISLLEQALSHNPELEDAYLFLGSSYFHIYQHEKALTMLERFAKLQPGNQEAAPLLADTQFRLGNYDKAVAGYLIQIRAAPAQPEPYYYLRECFLALAGACLRDLATQPEASYFHDLFAAEDLAAAAETRVRELIQRQPARPEAYVALGAMKLRERKQAEAKAALAQALKRDPVAGGFLIAVAAASPPMEKPCPVRGDLLIRAACLVNQDNLEAATKAGLALYESPTRVPRETYWALRIFSRLADKTVVRLTANAPQSSVLAIIRARIFEQAGDMAQAEAEYAKALALRQDPDSLIEYGKFQCRNSQFEQAISLFEKALTLDPDRPDVHGLIGEVYMITGNAAKALPHVRTAVQGIPNSAQTRIYLAQALQKLNQRPEAIQVLEAAPSDPDGRLHYLLARYLSQEGRKDQANLALQIFRERRKSGDRPAPLGSLTGAAVPEP